MSPQSVTSDYQINSFYRSIFHYSYIFPRVIHFISVSIIFGGLGFELGFGGWGF